ncbi:hypothetical protein [Branchiibius cervicis]|uniref:Uncharacterized protein n=1 Tax=Branchiibius cervicis TaxID=908252 RepID=A0ABW2AYN9_9MICO
MERLPHPVTGVLMTSPATPGDGWPGDHATPGRRRPSPPSTYADRRLTPATSPT